MTAQVTDSLLHQLDSSASKTGKAGFQKNNINEIAYNRVTQLSGQEYLLLLTSNLKQAITKPFHMTRGDWHRTIAFTASTIVLSAADEPLQQRVLKWRTQSAALRNTGNYVTRFGGMYEIFTLGGLETYGLLAHNQKMKTTVLLATQSYITGSVIESLLKKLSGRIRPGAYASTVEAEPVFTGPFKKQPADPNGKKDNSSFPSGHTTVAFAAATVFAKEYAHAPLIPVIAYSAATLVGLSRITENKHWLTDVVSGAVLGYLTGRQVSNNYHRLAEIKLKAARKKKMNITYNMQYHFGKMMPGLVCRF